MISVRLQGIAQVQARLSTLSSGMQAKVIGPAINKVAEKARAEIARAIPETYAVKPAEVRSSIRLSKARSGSLQATIEVFGSARKVGRSLNLIHFLAAAQIAGKAVKVRGARANKKQLAALQNQLGFLIKRGGGLKTIPGAFVGNKGRTIFIRTGKARLPIEPVQVIGFSQMFASNRIRDRILAKIKADLVIEVDRSLARLMAQGATP
jgi:ribosomal protein S26